MKKLIFVLLAFVCCTQVNNPASAIQYDTRLDGSWATSNDTLTFSGDTYSFSTGDCGTWENYGNIIVFDNGEETTAIYDIENNILVMKYFKNTIDFIIHTCLDDFYDDNEYDAVFARKGLEVFNTDSRFFRLNVLNGEIVKTEKLPSVGSLDFQKSIFTMTENHFLFVINKRFLRSYIRKE